MGIHPKENPAGLWVSSLTFTGIQGELTAKTHHLLEWHRFVQKTTLVQNTIRRVGIT